MLLGLIEFTEDIFAAPVVVDRAYGVDRHGNGESVSVMFGKVMEASPVSPLSLLPQPVINTFDVTEGTGLWFAMVVHIRWSRFLER